MKIILNRTDSIGDAIFTLPMAKLLRHKYKNAHIIYLGRKYVADIVAAAPDINEFVDWGTLENLPETELIEHFKKLKADVIIHICPQKQVAQIAKKAKIPYRIGTNRRSFHWWTCNSWVSLTRRRTFLHEAQLNLKLLKPLGIKVLPSILELVALTDLVPKTTVIPDENLIHKQKFNLVIHPGSNGSARDWPLAYFKKLLQDLSPEHFNILVTGSAAEAEKFGSYLFESQEVISHTHIHNVMGKFSLAELLSFIGGCDGLVSNSTGPLHMAAALGKYSLGLYPPRHTKHPRRWGPIGLRAETLVHDKKDCYDCDRPDDCPCMAAVTVESVKTRINSWLLTK